MANSEHLSPGSAEVAQNLANADHTQALVAHGAETHGELAFMGLGPGQFVSLAMAVFILILLIKKVPSLIGKGLDSKIAQIREQLDEASRLRAEAEALKAEYQAKIASAEKDAAAMRASAEEEAKQLLVDAGTEATALVARRKKMAEEKIAAAERAAVADVRARAASAATAAAAALITQHHDAKADQSLVDAVIAKVGTAH
ncbi:F0F1 ATP synthase subunit B family protein [Sphingobium sp. CR28]|uniref:F0F1 ATP synthase subunit B family protein n=1 Tax=Sphingobium sp. CR28 TaxID=3400272 RepID=UPI003FF0FA5B